MKILIYDGHSSLPLASKTIKRPFGKYEREIEEAA
jgi:hypothetical protein